MRQPAFSFHESTNCSIQLPQEWAVLGLEEMIRWWDKAEMIQRMRIREYNVHIY